MSSRLALTYFFQLNPFTSIRSIETNCDVFSPMLGVLCVVELVGEEVE